MLAIDEEGTIAPLATSLQTSKSPRALPLLQGAAEGAALERALASQLGGASVTGLAVPHEGGHHVKGGCQGYGVYRQSAQPRIHNAIRNAMRAVTMFMFHFHAHATMCMCMCILHVSSRPITFRDGLSQVGSGHLLALLDPYAKPSASSPSTTSCEADRATSGGCGGACRV